MAENESEKQQRRQLLFDFFIHEAETVNMRADWFLIFHAILFEAFMAANPTVQRVTLGLLGFAVSYVWLMVGIRQVWDFNHLGRSISNNKIMGSEIGSLFERLFEARRVHQPPWMRWASATPAFCIVLPFACMVAWLVIVTATAGAVACHVLLLVVGTLVGLTAFAMAVQGRPHASNEAVDRVAGEPSNGAVGSGLV